MNCNEFKEKVADLFDKTINMQTHAECIEHMANCPQCKAYYDELKETFDVLQPQEIASEQRPSAKRKAWRIAAAAAIFLLGFVIGWNHLFSTPAIAEDTRIAKLEQAIRSVQNVGSFQMDVYARTTPQENFAHFDPELPFVKTRIQVLRQNDTTFFRVEKAGGRTIVSDGRTQHMWIPNTLYLKAGTDANFLENFASLMYPERLLDMQKSAIALSKKNKATLTETDSTVVLTVEGTEKNQDLAQLLATGQMGDCPVGVENVFTKNDGLLRYVKLSIVRNDKKTMLLHIDYIHYNLWLNKSDIVSLPDTSVEWTDLREQNQPQASRLALLQNETAPQAAQRILQAIIAGVPDSASEALAYYQAAFPALAQKMKGCKVSDFQIRQDASYPGVYVFYTLTNPHGKEKKCHIALRNDNPQHIWVADGGL